LASAAGAAAAIGNKKLLTYTSYENSFKF